MVDLEKLNLFLGEGRAGQKALGILTLTRKSGQTGVIEIPSYIVFASLGRFFQSGAVDNPENMNESQNFVPYAVISKQEGSKNNMPALQPWTVDIDVGFTVKNEAPITGGLDEIKRGFFNPVNRSVEIKQNAINVAKPFIQKLLGTSELPDNPEIDQAVLIYCAFLLNQNSFLEASYGRDDVTYGKKWINDFSYKAMLMQINNLLSGHRDLTKYFPSRQATA